MFKGRVIDRRSGKPLCNIKVTDGLNVTFTDENGNYELAGWERARVVSIGSLTKRHNDWYIYAPEHRGDFDFSLELADVSDPDFCFLHNSDIEIENRADSDFLDVIRESVKKHKPAFFANTGDMCRDGIYRMYLAMNSENVGCPVRFAIGNHDFRGDGYGEEIYERFYGPTWYSFDCGQIHFVVLSIGKGDKPSGYRLEDQFNWLKNDLEAMDKDKRVIVLDHDFCKWDPSGHKIDVDGVSIDMRAHGLLAWVFGHFHINLLNELDGAFNICSSRPDSAGIDSTPASVRKISISGTSLESELDYFASPAWEGDGFEWRTQLFGRVEFSAPVEVCGDILVGTVDDGWPRKCGVFRINGANGDMVWSFETENSVKNSVEYSDGRVYAQDTFGKIYCIDFESGALIWEKFIETKYNHIVASPKVIGDKLIVNVHQGVYGLNKVSGEEIWFAEHVPTEACPAKTVYDEERSQILVNAHWKGLYAIDVATGRINWSNHDRIMFFRTSTPAVADGVIYTSGDVYLGKFDCETGRELALADIGFRTDVSGSPTVDGDTVYYPTAMRGVAAVDRETLCVKRTFATERARVFTVPYESGDIQAVECTPRIDGDVLYFSACDGYIYFYNKNTGELLRRIDTGAPLSTEPVFGEGYIITADFCGRVTKFKI